jgi:hypothetical protein
MLTFSLLFRNQNHHDENERLMDRSLIDGMYLGSLVGVHPFHDD